MNIPELEALAATRGYHLQVITSDGVAFEWRYRGDTDIAIVSEAVRMSLRNFADRHFSIQIEPCEMPSKPMAMQEWIAAGHTLD